MSKRVQINAGWADAGRQGTVIGENTTYAAEGGPEWTPVKWDDQDDPDWFKAAGLEEIPEKPKINTANLFSVGTQRDQILVGAPIGIRLSHEEALNLAAYLVVLTDQSEDHADFKELIEAIENV